MSTPRILVSTTDWITGSDSQIVQWIYFCTLICFIILCFYLMKKAHVKIQKITNPNTNHSYCVTSVTIVRAVILNIWLLLIGLGLQAVMIVNGTKIHPAKDLKELKNNPTILNIMRFT